MAALILGIGQDLANGGAFGNSASYSERRMGGARRTTSFSSVATSPPDG